LDSVSPAQIELQQQHQQEQYLQQMFAQLFDAYEAYRIIDQLRDDFSFGPNSLLLCARADPLPLPCKLASNATEPGKNMFTWSGHHFCCA